MDVGRQSARTPNVDTRIHHKFDDKSFSAAVPAADRGITFLPDCGGRILSVLTAPECGLFDRSA